MRSLLMNHDCLLSYELMKVFTVQFSTLLIFFLRLTASRCRFHLSVSFLCSARVHCIIPSSAFLRMQRNFEQKIENYRPPPPPSSHQSMLHRFHLRALCCCCCNERTTKTTPVLKEQNCICRCLINNSIVR